MGNKAVRYYRNMFDEDYKLYWNFKVRHNPLEKYHPNFGRDTTMDVGFVKYLQEHPIMKPHTFRKYKTASLFFFFGVWYLVLEIDRRRVPNHVITNELRPFGDVTEPCRRLTFEEYEAMKQFKPRHPYE